MPKEFVGDSKIVGSRRYCWNALFSFSVFLWAPIFGSSIASSAELGANIEFPMYYVYRAAGQQQNVDAVRYIRHAMFAKAVAEAHDQRSVIF